MKYDVVISGSGMVGGTLACLLAQSGKRVAVVERADLFAVPEMTDADGFDLRVSAISAASKSIFERIGVWSGVLARRLQAYEQMVVWDATGSGEIRFDAAELGEAALGYIIENRVIQLALRERMQDDQCIAIFSGNDIQALDNASTDPVVTLDDGRELRSSLLVGADGAHSSIRRLSHIGWQQDDYGQSGLVCVVACDHPHQQTAWQRFLPEGPIAFLPLPQPNQCSIVWTVPADQADRLSTLAKSEFEAQLAAALDYRLGAVELVSERQHFPLSGRMAERFIADGVALVGDAAHTIHPLAGQGVNLGLKDASVLADIVVDTSSAKALGDWRRLRRYERARRGDCLAVQKSMEGFSLLFGNTVMPLRVIRNSGLSVLNAMPVAKKLLVRRAMGI